MHAEDVGIVGALAQLAGDAIGVQRLGIAQPGVVVVGIQNLFAALGVDVAPLLGNDNVNAIQGIEVRGDGKGPIGSVLGVAGLHLFDHFLAHLMTEVVGADGEEVHVEHSAQTAIPHWGAGAVANESHLLAAARTQTAPLLFHRKSVSEHLSRVIAESKGIDDRDVNQVGDVIEELLVLLCAVDDEIVHAVKDAHGILDGLAVTHVGVGQISEAHAQIIAGGLECATSTGRAPLKVGEDVFAGEVALVDTRLLLSLKVPGKIDEIAEILGGKIMDVDVVATAEAVVHAYFLSNYYQNYC